MGELRGVNRAGCQRQTRGARCGEKNTGTNSKLPSDEGRRNGKEERKNERERERGREVLVTGGLREKIRAFIVPFIAHRQRGCFQRPRLAESGDSFTCYLHFLPSGFSFANLIQGAFHSILMAFSCISHLTIQTPLSLSLSLTT